MRPRSNLVRRCCLVFAAAASISFLAGCGTNDGAIQPPTPAPPQQSTPPPNPTPDPPSPSSSYTGVLKQRYDLSVTGQNVNETILTPANVNQASFGKLFSFSLDGESFAQPLYVSGVNIGGATYNVVFVETENDNVYAFDADGRVSSPLWSVNFTDPANGITPIPGSDMGGGVINTVGITGTPVIDGATGTLYVVAATKENGGYFYRLHALDIVTGEERLGSPVLVQASVAGNGAGSANGQVAFLPVHQLQRPGLLLLNGVVYIAFGSYNDVLPYHGWIFGYNASTLQQVAVWNSTPNGEGGGIWMAGASLSADAAGNIYAITGNGTFDAGTGGSDYGDSFVKLTPTGNSLIASDYFTPYDQLTLSDDDVDVGSSGFMLLPDQAGPFPHLGVSAGKSGTVYVLNRDNLGQYQSSGDSQVVQWLPGALGSQANNNDYSTATYWQGYVYFIGDMDVVKQFQLTNGLLSTSPVAEGTYVYGYPGANMTVSSNGAANGILWSIEASGVNVLHAYDATNVANEVYNTTQAGTRDNFGVAVRFTVPTVINGKVYVAGQTQLTVFGLF
ncbi:MAG TPA: hypothetical protein VJO35_07600 [Terriglobales bacterium]|nr:hypothetical protein [Terriglobales bacterium]